ncbi:MAG: ACT domain-containing protein [Pseudomonadota bacterium]
MKAEQISVFLENKAGRLAEVAAILAEAEVNIRALALADTSDFGVLRLIVNDNDRAETALKNRGFTVGKTDVVAVEVEDRPGGLHSILNILNREGVNVEYMYAFVQQSGDNAIMIFRFDNLDHAVEILQKNNVTVINGKEVYTL